jgi:hypothetical protein
MTYRWPSTWAHAFAGVLLMTSLTQVGCLVLHEDHCLANGGDLACPGKRCLLKTLPAKPEMSDELGCSYRGYDPTYHVNARYGLPADYEIGRDGAKEMDSVEDVLSALIEEHGIAGSCGITTHGTEEIQATYVGVEALRSRLDTGMLVRRNATKLTRDEVQAIHAYNAAVDSWLNTCIEASNAQR